MLSDLFFAVVVRRFVVGRVAFFDARIGQVDLRARRCNVL